MLSHSVSSIPRHWLRQLSTHSAHHYKTPSCEIWPVTHSDEILLDSDPVIWHFIWLCVSPTNWFSLPSITPSRFSWLTVWPRMELIIEPRDRTPGGPLAFSNDWASDKSEQLGTTKPQLTLALLHLHIIILSRRIQCVLVVSWPGSTSTSMQHALELFTFSEKGISVHVFYS